MRRGLWDRIRSSDIIVGGIEEVANARSCRKPSFSSFGIWQRHCKLMVGLQAPRVRRGWASQRVAFINQRLSFSLIDSFDSISPPVIAIAVELPGALPLLSFAKLNCMLRYTIIPASAKEYLELPRTFHASRLSNWTKPPSNIPHHLTFSLA